MITYQRDYKKQYDEKIKTLLRGHNELFSNIHDFSKLFIYVLEGENLVGAFNVNYFWDWVSCGDVFYKDIDVLKLLVKKVWDSYREKALGMKLFTTVKTRLDDFIFAGFTFAGTIKLIDNLTYYYADLTSSDFPLIEGYEVLVTEEPIKQYQDTLNRFTEKFNEAHQLDETSIDFDIAALDGEQCIGGLQANVYSELLYINRLAVDTKYRKQSIGSALTLQAIDYAKEKELDYVMLGTCEFQAKGFYEKLGFEVAHVRENNPKGYKSYTMLLNVKTS